MHQKDANSSIFRQNYCRNSLASLFIKCSQGFEYLNGMDVEDMIKVPFIAAQDATAVSGRVNTFKDKINSNNFLYGIMPRYPFQELRIKAVWEEGATDFV